MAIRRFRDHVADQNWFAVLIDIGIVVIGVFIGLQANNWNAARIERGEAEAYRVQIIDDLKANEEELSERLKYYGDVRAHAVSAMEALESGIPQAEPFLVDAYQATQVSPIRMERSAYDEMISSGMAKSFGDPAIRRLLSSYYAGTERLEAGTIFSPGYREWIRREMKFSVQERLRDRCSDVVSKSGSGLEMVELPEHCSLQLPPAEASRAATELSHKPELRQELTRQIGDLDVKVARFGRWLRDARETRQALEKHDVS
jgi:hypothetical protein